MQTHELIGRQGTDRITGFKGLITGRCEYITGCTQLLLTPQGLTKEGQEISGKWVDEQRVTVAPGKRLVLDNSKTPGPDLPAPVR